MQTDPSHIILTNEQRSAIERLSNVVRCKILGKLGGGKSDAGVFRAFTTFDNGTAVLCVLKIDFGKNLRRDLIFVSRFQDVLNDPSGNGVVAPLTPAPSINEDEMLCAAFYRFAGGTNNDAPALESLLLDESRMRLSLTSVVRLLQRVNPPETLLDPLKMTPENPYSGIIVRAAGIGKKGASRLDDLLERFIQAGIELDETEQFISFEHDNQVFPNPLYFASANAQTEGASRFSNFGLEILPCLGIVHGDLHSENVICRDEPILIDFGLSDDDAPVFFDWHYLEFDLLKRMQPVNSIRSWQDWLDLISCLTSGDSRNIEPWQFAKPNDAGRYHANIWAVVASIRSGLQVYWNAVDPHSHVLLRASYWLCGYFVGLNFARKQGMAILDRWAALYYAASCLRAALRCGRSWAEPVGSAKPYGPKPGVFMFGSGIDKLPSTFPPHIYLCATLDQSTQATTIRDNFGDVFVTPDAGGHSHNTMHYIPQESLRTTMETASHFMALIGAADDKYHRVELGIAKRPTVLEWSVQVARVRFRHDYKGRTRVFRAQNAYPFADLYDPPPAFVIEDYHDEQNNADLRRRVESTLLAWNPRQDPGLTCTEWDILSKCLEDQDVVAKFRSYYESGKPTLIIHLKQNGSFRYFALRWLRYWMQKELRRIADDQGVEEALFPEKSVTTADERRPLIESAINCLFPDEDSHGMDKMELLTHHLKSRLELSDAVLVVEDLAVCGSRSDADFRSHADFQSRLWSKLNANLDGCPRKFILVSANQGWAFDDTAFVMQADQIRFSVNKFRAALTNERKKALAKACMSELAHMDELEYALFSTENSVTLAELLPRADSFFLQARKRAKSNAEMVKNNQNE